jgi:predicted ester cyclase
LPENENRAVVRRIQEEVLKEGRLDLIDELFSADVIDHSNLPGFSPGREGIRQMIAMYRGVFENAQVNIESVVAEGDEVVSRCTISGTHVGEYLGIAPTGKHVKITVLGVDRVVDGRVVEHWEHFDPLVLMQMIDYLPSPE